MPAAGVESRLTQATEGVGGGAHTVAAHGVSLRVLVPRDAVDAERLDADAAPNGTPNGLPNGAPNGAPDAARLDDAAGAPLLGTTPVDAHTWDSDEFTARAGAWLPLE